MPCRTQPLCAFPMYGSSQCQQTLDNTHAQAHSRRLLSVPTWVRCCTEGFIPYLHLATKPHASMTILFQGEEVQAEGFPSSYASPEPSSDFSPCGISWIPELYSKQTTFMLISCHLFQIITFLATAVSGCEMLTPLKLHLVKLLISHHGLPFGWGLYSRKHTQICLLPWK